MASSAQKMGMGKAKCAPTAGSKAGSGMGMGMMKAPKKGGGKKY